MSQKNLDNQYRFRSVTVGFRMSPQESRMLNEKVKLSGLTKQDYLLHCIENRNYTIDGRSTRVYKELCKKLKYFEDVLYQTKEVEKLSLDELELFEYVLQIVVAIRAKKRAQIIVVQEPRQ